MRETDEMVDDDKPMEGEKMYKLRMDSVPKWHHGHQGVRLEAERSRLSSCSADRSYVAEGV